MSLPVRALSRDMDKRNTAWCDEMEPKNRFSTLLEHLMSVAALKHYVVAQALPYDVSYISKWIGGKALPAEKSAEDVLRRLSRCLVEQGEPQGLVQLIRDYQVQDEQELSLAIYDNLMAEYNYVRELQHSSGAVVAPNVAFYPQLPLKNFIGKMHHPVLRRVHSLDIMAVLDLFSMPSEYRMQAMGIQSGGYLNQYRYPHVHFSLMVSLRGDRKALVQDVMFLTSALTALSHIDLHLYGCDFAYGKALMAVRDDFAISGMLIRPDRCVAVNVCEGPENSAPLYSTIQALCTRERLLFQPEPLRDMLCSGAAYVQALLAPGQQWMLGRLTEHTLPDDLFGEILAQCEQEGMAVDRARLKELHRVAAAVMQQGRVRLLLYESAVSDLVVSGQVEFFDRIVQLTLAQRAQLLQQLMSWNEAESGVELRLIHGRLVPDFQYDVHPCMFLNEAGATLRLEGCDQVLHVNRPEMAAAYLTFFEEIWNGEAPGVVQEPEQIRQYLAHLLQNVRMLADIQPQNGEENK